MKLQARRANPVNGADDLLEPGDFYTRHLAVSDAKLPSLDAIILKCPYCGRDMASTHIHKIKFVQGLLRKLLGYPPVISVSPMLQCPYDSAHRFTISRGKIKALKRWPQKS